MTELTELVEKVKKKHCEYDHEKRKKHFNKGCPDCELMDKFLADLKKAVPLNLLVEVKNGQ